MTHPFVPYMIALLMAAAVSTGLAAYVWRLRRTPVGWSFIGLMLCSTLYTLGYALEISSSTLEGTRLWNHFQYTGIAFFPAFLVLFAARYAGKEALITKGVTAALFILSSLTLAFNLTNGLYHLYYRDSWISEAGPFPVMILAKGPAYWVHFGYVNISLLICSVLLIQTFRRSAIAYRKRTAIMIIGMMLPWLGYLVYISGLSPHHLDTTPLAFTLTGPFLAWGLVRFKLLDIVPVAKESVFSSMRDGAVVLDAQDRIVDFNPAALTVLQGLTPRSIGLDVSDFLLDRPEILEMLCPGGRPEADFKTGEGDSRLCYRASLSPILNRRGDSMGRILLFRDTTEQVRMTEKFEALAKIDDLTGTLNRRAFVEEGRKEIQRAKRYAYPLSLLIIDLDHFKGVNDTWGHEVGDNVLKAACRAIRAVWRDTDHFGRHGGEEFAVLLHKTPPESACLVAERLRLAIAAGPVRLKGGEVVAITASVGVYGLDRIGNETLDDLVRAADRAMYKAKDAGRNCVRCF